MTAIPRATIFARDMLALTKPRITAMTLIVAGVSMLLAPERIALLDAALVLLGIALLVSGSSALNMYLERDYDGLMDRTRDRPLPAGRMAAGWALLLGFLLSVAALPALYFGANALTLWLGISSLIAYVLIYTPMKRVSSFSLVVGAIPGAMPSLLGYTAALGAVDRIGMALFGLAFLWQLPHFIAISIFRRRDYTNAGYPVVAQIVGMQQSKNLIVLTSILLVANSFLLWIFQLGGLLYGVASVGLGGWFLYACCKGYFGKDDEAWAKQIFMHSLVYQSLLFGALLLDHCLRMYV